MTLNWLNLLCIAVGLAMDAFAVSIVAGLSVSPLTPRHIFRPAFHFGLFQFMMPVFGWMVGKQIAEHVAAYDHWIVAGLLGFVGGKMLWEAFSEDLTQPKSDPTRGLMLVTLSLATSIDAFAVGLSIAFLRNGIWIPALVIGLVAAALERHRHGLRQSSGRTLRPLGGRGRRLRAAGNRPANPRAHLPSLLRTCAVT